MVSEEMTILEKLLELRKSVPYMQETAKGQNCTYTKGVDILNVVKPIMDKLNLLLIPSVENHKIECIDNGMSQSGNPKKVYLVSGTMMYTWVDVNTGSKLDVPFGLFGKNDDAGQAFGSALTYTERYFLLKFLQIETDKDDPDARIKKAETKKEKDLNDKKIVLFNFAKSQCGISKATINATDKEIIKEWCESNWSISSLNDADADTIEGIYKEVAL